MEQSVNNCEGDQKKLFSFIHSLFGSKRITVMITNKLKINDSKTEFVVFRSPQLKCDLSGFSVNVDESHIRPISQL